MGANNQKLSAKEISEIRRLNGLGFNDENIAEIIGRHRNSVNRYRVSMGLPARSIYTEMSKRKQKKSIRASMRRDTGGRMNYLAMVNEVRAMQVGWPDCQLSEALILYTLEREGVLETPSVLAFVNDKRTLEGWRPLMSHQRFCECTSSLKRSGLIETVYNERPVSNRRKLPRKYQLTEKAYETIARRARMFT